MARLPYLRHVRHRQYDRVRHSSRLIAWLSEQAVRLGNTAQDIFWMLKAGMTAAQIADTAPPVPAPENTVAPAITGTATVGSTLTVSNGTWTGSPTGYTYAWLSGGTVVSGQTAHTYVVVAGDAGKAITARVTATNATASATATSNAVNIPAA